MRPEDWDFIRVVLMILALIVIVCLLLLGLMLLTSYVISIMPTELSTLCLGLC